MRIHFIIDGYNLIHALPSRLKREDSLESMRERLVELIKRSPLYAGHKFTIVFDGVKEVFSQKRSSGKHLSILYSRPPDNADRLILKICSQEKDYKKIEVISSDREHIIRQVESMGIRTTSSEQFAQRLLRRRRTSSPPPHEKPDPSPDDISYWKNIFDRAKNKSTS